MITLEAYKSGHFEKGLAYRYFVPSRINEQWTWTTPEVGALLEKAAVRLGELNSFARLVPNIDLFIQLHVTKEAVDSSRIEGTQTNMEEAVLPSEEILPERRNDWQEVSNYTCALNQAVEDLQRLPLSSRLLRQTHAILLSGVRGEHKLPGEYRRSQNWIGGSSLADATFIPAHHQYLNDLMGDLENFLHNDQIHVPALIKAAIAHYQFETIHPFLDGNGRIERLLITLYLISEGLLDQPLLYLSAYFEKNKTLYYDNLTRVRTHNDMRQWIKYFLVGIEQTASDAVHQLREMLRLKEDIERSLHNNFGRRMRNAQVLLLHLFKHPVVSVDHVAGACNITYKAANDLVTAFVNAGYLRETSGQSRNRWFSFYPYLHLFVKPEIKEGRSG
jgi:Fic family protein